jgi:hypothetical protein
VKQQGPNPLPVSRFFKNALNLLINSLSLFDSF